MIGREIRVARRYARALLALAEENNILERAYQDMKYIYSVFSLEKELKVVLNSPIVREKKKQRIISRLFEGKVHPVIHQYLQIIVRKRRSALLDGISEQFQHVYKEHLGIERVKVTTALPIDEPLREKVLSVVRKLTDKEVEFHEEVNPRIIGGFILNLGEKQYDASIKRKLDDIRKHLNT